MSTFVVPFKLSGKTRLGNPEIAWAMFLDVRSACEQRGEVRSEAARLTRSARGRRHVGRSHASRAARRPEHAERPAGTRVKVAVLSGGFGGAKFVRALVETLGGRSVTAIVNVGDDVEVLGVHVSPDLDSVLYALAGLADEERGWGRADETWNAL